jgi:uncharacterized protein YkuJ
MTYQDLIERLQKLTPEQRGQTVATLGCERNGREICDVWIAEEDHIAPEDGLEPVSIYSDDPDYEDEPVVVEKGRVLLAETE